MWLDLFCDKGGGFKASIEVKRLIPSDLWCGGPATAIIAPVVASVGPQNPIIWLW